MNILFSLTPKIEVAYVKDHNTVRQVMEKMEFHKYSCIPILDDYGYYRGVITEGDLLWGIKSMISPDIKNKLEHQLIMDLPQRAYYEPVHVEVDMKDLVHKAMNQNFVPVVDDQQHFIGIITRKSLIEYCYAEFLKNPDNQTL